MRLGLVALATLLLASIAFAQPTPEDEAIQQEAMRVAKEVLYGDAEAAVALADESFFAEVISRQAQYLSKQAAVARWSNVSSADVLAAAAAAPAPALGPAAAPAALEEEGEEPAAAAEGLLPRLLQHSRRLAKHKSKKQKEKGKKKKNEKKNKKDQSNGGADAQYAVAGDGCVVREGATHGGAEMPGGYLIGVEEWSGCCAWCAARPGCAAWTFIPASGSHPGCHLQAAGYSTTADFSRGNVAGYMSADAALDAAAPVGGGAGSGGGKGDAPIAGPAPAPRSSLPEGKAKYGEVLGLSWLYFEAQRSGPEPAWDRVPWRAASHLADPVVGGWYDAGDFLKLNFVLAPTVGYLAWGLDEFREGYEASGNGPLARANLRLAATYLLRCYDPVAQTYVGQIGDPKVDHNYWGRPEEQGGARPAFVYTRAMGAADLFGNVAGALAASAFVLRGEDPAFAAELGAAARDLWAWAAQKPGKYSDYYPKQTKSIYPSSDYLDSVAWGAAWLWRLTGDPSYLTAAAGAWAKGDADVYPGWDSLWAPTAVMLVNAAERGTAGIPGIEAYADFVRNKFMRAWIAGDGFQEIVKTPLGMHYPAWNQWANLQFSTTAAFMALLHARTTPDADLRRLELDFARRQVDYALGSGLRSYVVGYGNNPPQFAHHAAASCPDRPAVCSMDATFDSKAPNGQVLYGALVAGPAGKKKDAANPDATYYDKRDDYITNEVANDYNAGFTGALAGLFQLL